MQEVLEVRAQRQQTRAEEQARARTYWEARKEDLGLTSAMDVTAQLAVIETARGQAREPLSTRQVLLGAVGLEQDDRMLGDLAGEASAQAQHEARAVWEDAQAEQALLNDGWAAVRGARIDGHAALAAELHEQAVKEQARAWRSLEHDLLALAAQLDALSEESGGRGTVRIRLWEREQGLGW